MPTVALVAGFAILFYWQDHDPPHFHIVGKGVRAKMTLGDLVLTETSGTFKPAELRTVREWARRNMPALYENWQRAQQGRPLVKIGE